MFIDHKRKFVFFHLEKTAGTFIENKLCEILGVENWRCDWASHEWQNGKPNKTLEGQFTKHLMPKQLFWRWGKERFDDYFKFACVRNPWDLWVSYFSMCRQWEKFASVDGHQYRTTGRIHCLNDFVNFDDFVLKMHNFENQSPAKKQFDKLSNYQTKFLGFKNRVNEPVLVDKLIKFESLQQNLDDVCETLDLEKIDTNDKTTKSRNNGETKNCSSKHGSARDEIGLEASNVIARVCQNDIGNFGFSDLHPYFYEL